MSAETIDVDGMQYQVKDLPESIQLTLFAYELAVDDRKNMVARLVALDAAIARLSDQIVTDIRAISQPLPVEAPTTPTGQV
jgi:hypothetical protein